MPKARDLTSDEITQAAELAMSAAGDIRDLDERLRRNFMIEIDGMAEKARVFADLAKVSASLSHALLIRISHDEERARIEESVRAELAAAERRNEE